MCGRPPVKPAKKHRGGVLKRILVTGSNRGIGLEVTRRYLEQVGVPMQHAGAQPRRNLSTH